VSTALVIGGGTVAGVLSNPEARNWVATNLSGRVLPVSKVPGLGVQLNLRANHVLLGLQPRCRSAAVKSTRLRARRLNIGAWRAAESVCANPLATLERVIPSGHRQRLAIPHHPAATPVP
jgi:hypothetical protein